MLEEAEGGHGQGHVLMTDQPRWRPLSVRRWRRVVCCPLSVVQVWLAREQRAAGLSALRAA